MESLNFFLLKWIICEGDKDKTNAEMQARARYLLLGLSLLAF